MRIWNTHTGPLGFRFESDPSNRLIEPGDFVEVGDKDGRAFLDGPGKRWVELAMISLTDPHAKPEAEPEPDEDDEDELVATMDMSKDDLLAMADQLDLDVKASATKAELIEAINGAVEE